MVQEEGDYILIVFRSRAQICCLYLSLFIDRYADFLIREEDDNALPFCMATKDTAKLIHFLISKGQMKDAVLVAQVACEDDREISQTPSSTTGNCVHVNGVAEPSEEKLQYGLSYCITNILHRCPWANYISISVYPVS